MPDGNNGGETQQSETNNSTADTTDTADDGLLPADVISPAQRLSGLFTMDISTHVRLQLTVATLSETSVSLNGTSAQGDVSLSGNGALQGSALTASGTLIHPTAGTLAFTLIATVAADVRSFSGTLTPATMEPMPVYATKDQTPTFDPQQDPVPKLATADFLQLEQIQRISKFRSGMGHDFSDEFEKCRSMKHYYQRKSTAVEMEMRSPVAGTIVHVESEQLPNSGKQIHIRSALNPAFVVRVFHVGADSGITKDVTVSAGQRLGVAKTETTDIAVMVFTPSGMRLISYFELMSDALFAAYQGRGITTRQVPIITRSERDAAPLACNGESFLGQGSLENWVDLQ